MMRRRLNQCSLAALAVLATMATVTINYAYSNSITTQVVVTEPLPVGPPFMTQVKSNLTTIQVNKHSNMSNEVNTHTIMSNNERWLACSKQFSPGMLRAEGGDRFWWFQDSANFTHNRTALRLFHLQEAIQHDDDSGQPGPILSSLHGKKFLLIGDSNDRRIVTSMCGVVDDMLLGMGKTQHHTRHMEGGRTLWNVGMVRHTFKSTVCCHLHAYEFTVCSAMAPGVTGEMSESRKKGYLYDFEPDLMVDKLSELNRTFAPDAWPPDILLINSGLWDVDAVKVKDNSAALLQTFQPLILQVLKKAREVVGPAVPIIWRNTHQPKDGYVATPEGKHLVNLANRNGVLAAMQAGVPVLPWREMLEHAPSRWFPRGDIHVNRPASDLVTSWLAQFYFCQL